MTYSIQQNKNMNAYQPAMGVAPQLQGVDTDKIRQGVKDNPVSKVTEHTNPFVMAALFLPTWLLVHLGMQKFSEANQGEYSKSLVGRAEAYGEKLAQKPIFNNDVVKKAGGFYSQAKDFLNKKVIDNSQILRSMFRTPAVPENKMVLTMAGGITSEIASSAAQLFDQFTKDGTDLNKIIELGFNKGTAGNAVADVEKYQEYVKNSHKYTKEIQEICEKQGDKVFKIERGGSIPGAKRFTGSKKYITDIIPKSKVLFARDVHFSEYANKLKGSKKGLSRFMLRIVEGMTNAGAGASGAGAVIASVMGAFFIVDAVNRTMKAPKGPGEKRKTFAENMVYNLGMYLSIPITVKTMFGVGGLQYIGMSKDDVAKYREKLAEFNKKVLDEKFATKAEYKTAKKELKEMLKGSTKIASTDSASAQTAKVLKNIIFKPLKWAGKTFMVGLEGIHGFRAPGASENAKKLADLGFKFKNYSSYPVRLLAFILVFSPFFAKLFVKGSHLVFGKPTVSVLDDEDDQAKKISEKNAGRVVTAAATGALRNNEVESPTQVKQVAPMGQTVVSSAPTPVSTPLPSQAKTPVELQSSLRTSYPLTQPKSYFNNEVNQNQNAMPPMNPTGGFSDRNMLQQPQGNIQSVGQAGMQTAGVSANPSMIPQEKPQKTYSYMPSALGVKIVSTPEQAIKDEKFQKVMDKSQKMEDAASKRLGGGHH